MKINGSDGVNQFGITSKYKTGKNLTVSDKEVNSTSLEEAGVTLEISENSRGRVDVNNFDASAIKEQMEQLREQSKAAEKSGIINSKCMTISLRIASGDEVPLKDIMYLQKHRSDLYDMAMKMRILKTDPEKYDSIVDDDEDDDTSGNENHTSDDNGSDICNSENACVEVSEPMDI